MNSRAIVAAAAAIVVVVPAGAVRGPGAVAGAPPGHWRPIAPLPDSGRG